jgi:hypothetical protein
MSVSLCPPVRFQGFYPGTGNPLSGGYLYSVQPGTAAPAWQGSIAYPMATYTDSTGLVPNTNPIILDGNGQADVWLSGYTKLVLYDMNGNLVWTRDNVSSMANLQPSTLQFIPQSAQPTFVSASGQTGIFSVPGNYTSTFQVGTAVQATITGGNVYGEVQSIYASGTPTVTTVTVWWFTTVINSSLSAVAAGILTPPGVGSAMPLYPTVPITTPGSGTGGIGGSSGTGSTTFGVANLFQPFIISSSLTANLSLTLPAASTVPPGSWLRIRNGYTGSAYTVQFQTTIDGAATPYMAGGIDWYLWSDGSSWHVTGGFSISGGMPTQVRQTVLSGPVDANGNVNFGGSTGSTTVTMNATIIATAANGFTANGQQNDAVGVGANLSWTNIPATAGTYYLYVTVTGGGLTPGITPMGLVPIYEWGGTPSSTNGQFTFLIQQMQGFMGNGTSAPQANIIFVGEVNVSSNVVQSITWYQLMGRYTAPWTATLPSNGTTTTINHNLGIMPSLRRIEFLCTTNDSAIGAYAGDVLDLLAEGSGGWSTFALPATRNSISFTAGSSSAGYVGQILSTGDFSGINSKSNFSYRVIVNRGW